MTLSVRVTTGGLALCLLILPATLPAADMVMQHRFQGPVTLLALSDRGRHAAASVDQAGGLQIVDLGKRQPIVLRSMDGIVTMLRFSPDGRWLLAGSINGHMRLIETETGKTLVEGQVAKRFSVDPSYLFVSDPGLADFSPDSRWLAVADCAGRVQWWPLAELTHVGWRQRLWNFFSSRRPLPESRVVTFPANSHCQLRFSRDGRRLYVAYGLRVVTVDPATSRVERTEEGDPRGNRLVLSPTGAHATLLIARGSVAFVSQALGEPPMPKKELITEEEFFRIRVDGYLLFARAILGGNRFVIISQRARYGVYTGDQGDEVMRPTYFSCMQDYARAHSPYTDDRNQWILSTCNGSKELLVSDMENGRTIDRLSLEQMSELRDAWRPYILTAVADSRSRLIVTGSPDGWLRVWRVPPPE